ncbi:MAG TPA: glycosyltransferase [Bryobacteraceae bacterium]|nr:glycosyltransferase [Bryobacteraceae bacterium]
MKRVDFVFFDAGGGHRAAATALRGVIEAQRRQFDVRLVNLQELLDSIDIFRKLTGLRLQDLYNLMLKKGWTLGSPQMTAGMHAVIRLFHQRQVRLLAELWKRNRPDMVVSLVPNFNRAQAESLDRALPGVPFVTILTDLADYPPHFWIERPLPLQPQYVVCGSDRAVEQALAMGHERARVFRVSGMILNPRFYELQPLAREERAEARARLGFRAEEPVGLVLFGGQGAAVMLDIARRLGGRQLLLICGHNARLADKLRRYAPRHGAPIFVEGFTQEVPRYMQLADYLIGKPGPGSISEAVHMRLPVIVERNAWTLPQERYNADWVREQGVGIVLRNFRGEIAQGVDRLLDPAAYARFRAATGKHENRAVCEIAEILDRLLAQRNPSP